MYPQQYQDLLEFLDSNPEYLHDMRVRLLSPELIAVVKMVDYSYKPIVSQF